MVTFQLGLYKFLKLHYYLAQDFLSIHLMFTIPKNPYVIYQGEECYMLFKFESFYEHSSFREVLSHTELNIIAILLSIEKLRKRRLEWSIWAKKSFHSSLHNFQTMSGIIVYEICPCGVSGHSSLNLNCTWSVLYLNHILHNFFIHGILILHHPNMLIKQGKKRGYLLIGECMRWGERLIICLQFRDVLILQQHAQA